MRTVKKMVEQIMHQQRRQRGPATDLPENLQEQYMSLLKQEVAEEIADEVVQRVRGGLTPAQLEDRGAGAGASAGVGGGVHPGGPGGRAV